MSTEVRTATLDFYHPWPHAAGTVRALAAEYTLKTGTKVRVRVYSPASYSPWRSSVNPDIVGLYRPTKRSVEDLARQGRIYNIEREMAKGWYVRFWPGMLETFRIRSGGDGIYGVPLTGQVYLFVYNKNAFQRAGISRLPRTWSELMTASQRLRQVGYIPYAGGFGSDKPPLSHVYEWSYLGIHRLSETYNGRYPYTASTWIQNLGLYREMRIYGFTTSGYATLSETSAIKALLDNRVAIVFVGPVFESIRQAYKPGFSSWGLFDAPVDRRAGFLPRLPGGVVEGAVVNRRSDSKVESARFLRWLTEPRQQVILANGASSLPATPAASSSLYLRSHLRAFSSGMRDQSVDLRVYERPQVLRAFYGGTRNILRGSTTPLAVARYTQAVKRR